jgi:hypothetical protein
MKKSRAFPKLDHPKRVRVPRGTFAALKRTQRASVAEVDSLSSENRALTTIDRETWISWRMKLGANRKDATALWQQYQEWLGGKAASSRVRVLKVEPWQDWEREFRAFLDQMPRKPSGFLARVAAAEKKRAQQAVITARKARGKKRFRRQYAKRARESFRARKRTSRIS